MGTESNFGAETGGLKTNSVAKGFNDEDEVRSCPFDLAVFANALGTAKGNGGRFDTVGAAAFGEECCCFFASGKSCVCGSSFCSVVPDNVLSILCTRFLPWGPIIELSAIASSQGILALRVRSGLSLLTARTLQSGTCGCVG